jgi:hypothetical protein
MVRNRWECVFRSMAYENYACWRRNVVWSAYPCNLALISRNARQANYCVTLTAFPVSTLRSDRRLVSVLASSFPPPQYTSVCLPETFHCYWRSTSVAHKTSGTKLLLCLAVSLVMCYFLLPSPVAWVCGRSLAGTAGSNPAGVMDVCLLWVWSVVR